MNQPDVIEAQARPLAIREETPQPASLALFGSDDPTVALDRAVSVANVLKKLIVAQGYAKKLGRGDREFVEVAGWQALGGFLDTFAQVEWSRPIERGFESRVQLIRRGQIVGAGEAICTRDERNWKDRDDFAIKSMSQTRAAGKAFRLTFGWLMTIAGYESTPQEEMTADAPSKPAARPVQTHAAAPPAADFPTPKDCSILARNRGLSEALYRSTILEVAGDREWPNGKPSSTALSQEERQRLYDLINERTQEAAQ